MRYVIGATLLVAAFGMALPAYAGPGGDDLPVAPTLAPEPVTTTARVVVAPEPCDPWASADNYTYAELADMAQRGCHVQFGYDEDDNDDQDGGQDHDGQDPDRDHD